MRAAARSAGRSRAASTARRRGGRGAPAPRRSSSWEAHAAKTSGDPAHLRASEVLGGTERLVDRRLDHVGEHLGLLGVDRLGVDRDLAEGEIAAHLDLDHPAAGARLDYLVL